MTFGALAKPADKRRLRVCKTSRGVAIYRRCRNGNYFKRQFLWLKKFSGTLNVRTAFRAPEKGRRTAHSYKRTRTVPPFSATGRAHLRRKAYALCPSFGLDTFCLVPTAWKFRTDWMKPSLAGNGRVHGNKEKKEKYPGIAKRNAVELCRVQAV